MRLGLLQRLHSTVGLRDCYDRRHARIAAFVFKLYSLSTHMFDVKLLIGVNVLHAGC